MKTSALNVRMNECNNLKIAQKIETSKNKNNSMLFLSNLNATITCMSSCHRDYCNCAKQNSLFSTL